MLYHFIQSLVNFFYCRYAAWKYGIKIGRAAYISRSSVFEGKNAIGNKSLILNSKLGYGSYISEHSVLNKCSVGRFCSLGPYIRCVYGNHPTHTFVSTHPSFFSPNKQAGFSFTDVPLFEEFSDPKTENGGYSIHIGNDVWIGAGVTLLDGVKIGDGAIIAANALITKNVAPYSIVGGVPARPIRSRFDEATIQYLLQFKWWERDIEWIKEHAALFTNISDFQAFFKKQNSSL